MFDIAINNKVIQDPIVIIIEQGDGLNTKSKNYRYIIPGYLKPIKRRKVLPIARSLFAAYKPLRGSNRTGTRFAKFLDFEQLLF